LVEGNAKLSMSNTTPESDWKIRVMALPPCPMSRIGVLTGLVLIGLFLLAVITLADGACSNGIVDVGGIPRCLPDWVWTA